MAFQFASWKPACDIVAPTAVSLFADLSFHPCAISILDGDDVSAAMAGEEKDKTTTARMQAKRTSNLPRPVRTRNCRFTRAAMLTSVRCSPRTRTQMHVAIRPSRAPERLPHRLERQHNRSVRLLGPRGS